MKKLKISALILAATMIIGLMPTGVYAQNSVTGTAPVDQKGLITKSITISNPAENSASENSASDNASSVNSSSTSSASKTVATAAAKTITVKKVDTAVVKNLHKQLTNAKAVTLKVKGKKSAADKLVKKLRSKIQAYNKDDVVFQYKYSYTSSGYSYYNISSDDAKMYKYSVKFVDKLWKYTKSQIKNSETLYRYVQDYQLYPNWKDLKMRVFYERVLHLNVYYDKEHPERYINYTEETINYMYYECPSYNEYWEQLRDLLIQNVEEVTEAVEDSPGYYRVYNIYTFCTYDEFAEGVKEICPKLVDSITPYVDAQKVELAIKLYGTTNFGDLSDAMKVYAVATSTYFCGYPDKYGMPYNMKKRYTSDYTWKQMKKMYENKAVGVCHDFAVSECVLWNQLGITCWYNCSYEISHAWSVVKVKNSKGKTMWIPFDYGIGPNEYLAVSEDVRKKYLKTEAMRYKLYLRGIKGAPSKKNFKMSDFN